MEDTDLTAQRKMPRGTPLTGKPFGIAFEWVKFFLAQSPSYDVRTLKRDEFELFFSQSAEQFGPVFSADDPDLTRFRNRGGKLIITHGLADQLIPPQSTIEYYERVQQRMVEGARGVLSGG